MNQLEELTDGMMEDWRAFREGAMKREDLDASANMAGKIIARYKLQLAHDVAVTAGMPAIRGLTAEPQAPRLAAE